MYSHLIHQFVEEESLPATYVQDATQYIVPLANLIAAEIFNLNKVLIIGVNGAQGTGKTTLTKLLVKLLKEQNHNIANLSIDDFYLTKLERQHLAHNLHPLLRTRGVPGTHDISLLLTKVDELKCLKINQICKIPRFNKAIDDRFNKHEWQHIKGPVDAIILEGWCIGIPPQESSELEIAINGLEASEDQDCSWREHVNSELAGQYQQVFGQIAKLIMLKAPSFEQIYKWRALQEEKLKKISSVSTSSIMNKADLSRFIQHYERLTRHSFAHLPAKADVLYELASNHRIEKVSGLNC